MNIRNVFNSAKVLKLQLNMIKRDNGNAPNYKNYENLGIWYFNVISSDFHVFDEKLD